MEIDYEEQKAPKMIVQLIKPLFRSSGRVSSARRALPRNDAVKPTCSRDNLHNGKEI
jgi:hypothetical protein